MATLKAGRADCIRLHSSLLSLSGKREQEKKCFLFQGNATCAMPQKGKASKRLKIAKGADSKHTHADTEAVTDRHTHIHCSCNWDEAGNLAGLVELSSSCRKSVELVSGKLTAGHELQLQVHKNTHTSTHTRARKWLADAPGVYVTVVSWY